MRRFGPCLAALALIAAPCGADATSTGIVFNSGKQGSDCNSCHSGGSAPLVRFDGPAEVVAGQMATYVFSVESQAGGQTRAGFNVAASAGTLGVVANQGEKLLIQEVTHTGPKLNVGGIATWTFTWIAPAAPGPQTLFGAGNSVNFNKLNTGDRAARATLVVQVVDANITPTPTSTAAPPPSHTPTRPSPTDTATSIPTAAPTSTAPPPPTQTATEPPPTGTATSAPTATPTNSRRPTPVPTSTGTPTATMTATLAATPSATPVLESQPGNANCDDRLSAADIVALLPLLPHGAPGACALADANCDLVVSPVDLETVIGALFADLPPLCG